MGLIYKRLAASSPAVTTEAELYPVPSDAEIIATLTICNQTATAATYSVAHTDASGVATAEDWIRFGKSLAGNDSIEISISAGNSETIRISAGTVDALSFVLAGMLKT